MKWFDILKPDLDPKYQLITQTASDNYDGGDCAQREGMFAFGAVILHDMGLMSSEELQFVSERYKKSLDLLNDPENPGFLRRYPDPAYWGGLSDRFSRDQSVPNVVAMGFMAPEHLKAFFRDHMRRGLLFTTNTRKNWAWPPGHPEYDPKQYRWKLPDLTVLGFWGLYIRAFRCKWLYPLLWITDLDNLLGSINKVYNYGSNAEHSDDLNHLVTLYQAEMVMPTLWSKLALRIYKKRPYPRLSGLRPAPGNAAQACFDHYFRDYIGKGPKLEEIYEPINRKFLENK